MFFSFLFITIAARRFLSSQIPLLCMLRKFSHLSGAEAWQGSLTSIRLEGSRRP